MNLSKGKEVVLTVSDMQIPFQHRDTFDFLAAVYLEYSPTRVVCIGDSLDCHALSKYIANPDGYSAGHEHKKAVKTLQEFYKLFPEGIEVQSNHNVRAWKRAYDAGIPSAFLKDYKDVVDAPSGWEFVHKTKIDNVIYEHGDAFQGQYAARTAASTNMLSTVIGHHHSFGGIHYISNNDKMIFGMNVGCLIDIDQYAFEYAKNYKSKPTLGCGIVDRGVPKFIPLMQNANKRWIKEII